MNRGPDLSRVVPPAQVMDLEAELKSARERAKSSEARSPSPPKQKNCASVLF